MGLDVRPIGLNSIPPPGGLLTKSLRRLPTGLLRTSFGGSSPPQFPEELALQLARLLHRSLSELRSTLLHPFLSGLHRPLRHE